MKLLSIVLLPSVSAFIIQHNGFIGSSRIVKHSTIPLSASLETVLENEENQKVDTLCQTPHREITNQSVSFGK